MYFQDFCNRTLDLNSPAEKDKLSIVRSELPALWQQLSTILKYEKAKYLLPDIAAIVKKLLKMRKEIFDNSTPRASDDYVPWPDPDKAYPQ